MVVLGLCCCAWAFSSCGARASHHSDVSCCRSQARGDTGSIVVAHRLGHCTACGPKITPMSPLSAGGFLPTVSPGKSIFPPLDFCFSHPTGALVTRLQTCDLDASSLSFYLQMPPLSKCRSDHNQSSHTHCPSYAEGMTVLFM